MTELVIRTAQVDDAGDITAIYNDAVLNTTATFDLEPETGAARRAWLARESTLLALVAVAGDQLLGWASLVRWSERGAYEHTAEASVYVTPHAHRAGVGSALSRALLERAPSLGLHAVIAQICAENRGGLALAERLGFVHTGVLHEVGFKFGRWLDVVVCQKTLKSEGTQP